MSRLAGGGGTEGGRSPTVVLRPAAANYPASAAPVIVSAIRPAVACPAERLQEPLCDRLLWGPELSRAALGQAVQNGESGYTRLDRDPTLDIGEVRIEH